MVHCCHKQTLTFSICTDLWVYHSKYVLYIVNPLLIGFVQNLFFFSVQIMIWAFRSISLQESFYVMANGLCKFDFDTNFYQNFLEKMTIIESLIVTCSFSVCKLNFWPTLWAEYLFRLIICCSRLLVFLAMPLRLRTCSIMRFLTLIQQTNPFNCFTTFVLCIIPSIRWVICFTVSLEKFLANDTEKHSQTNTNTSNESCCDNKKHG